MVKPPSRPAINSGDKNAYSENVSRETIWANIPISRLPSTFTNNMAHGNECKKPDSREFSKSGLFVNNIEIAKRSEAPKPPPMNTQSNAVGLITVFTP